MASIINKDNKSLKHWWHSQKSKQQFCLLMETSSSKGALGLYSFKGVGDMQVIELKTWIKDHSPQLNSAFEKFFQNHKEILSLKFLALGVGPGRWTGVRVGVSFAKAFNFVSTVPLYPVSSLKILAESQFHQEKPILVLMNAFKNSLYVALYQRKGGRLREVIAPTVILPNDVSGLVKTNVLCVGDGYGVYESFFSKSLKSKLEVKDNVFPEVSDLAKLLNREFDSSQLVDWRKLLPVYLRSPVPTLKKP